MNQKEQKVVDSVKRGKLDIHAYEILKNKIITGELAPNQSLVETDLAEELKISRTPVRTAIKMLESSQLVKIIPGRGAFVTDVTMQDIDELFDYRILLECAALKNFVQHAPEELIEEHIRRFTQWREMTQFNEEYHGIDTDFHMDIIQYIGNSRMLNTYMQLHDQIDRFRHIAVLDPSRLRSTPDEHLEILKAMKERDFEKAQSLLRNHLEKVKDSTKVAFGIYMREAHSYNSYVV